MEGALRSILAQTRLPDELIVVDDGSTDATADLVRRVFPQVRYFYQKNKGVSAARNLGMRRATGQWLALLDSDDEWFPEKLARQLAELDKHPDLLVSHTNEIWIRNGKPANQKKRHKKYGGRIFKKCLPLCVISPSSVMLHRSVLRQVGMFDESLPVCEDYDLWLRLCARFPVHFLDRPLTVKHGGHEDQLSHKYWGMDRFRIRALEKIVGTGDLSRDNQYMALRTLSEKTAIYVKGAQRRGRWEEVRRYQTLLERLEIEPVNDLDPIRGAESGLK